MIDDASKSIGARQVRIDINEAFELNRWSKKFGVAPFDLKIAVRAVGAMADDVEQYLKSKQR